MKIEYLIERDVAYLGNPAVCITLNGDPKITNEFADIIERFADEKKYVLK